MKTLLDNPPPLGHPDRAEWNRRLDQALAEDAGHVAAMAQQAGREARSRGDMAAAVAAGSVEAGARKVARAGMG